MYSAINKQKVSTFFVVLGFTLFVAAFVYAISLYFGAGSLFIVPIALGIASISSLVIYYNSDKIVLKLNGARFATDEEDRQLRLLLEGIVLATGLPEPRLYVIDDMSMNAFATGRNPENSVICVTKGLMEKLDKYELEAVLAHELSHIKNYDILLSTVIAVMVGFIVVIADMLRRLVFTRRRGSSRKGELIGYILLLIFALLSSVFAKMIQFFISRKREYLADASAVEITRNKDAMISALQQLRGDHDVLEVANKSTLQLYIVEPVKRLKIKEKSNLFSTHPSIRQRVEAINNLY